MNRLNKRRLPSLRLLGLTALLACTVQARADEFPSRPITLVSPYQAGGSSDGIARAMALVAARDLGQPVIVEAKPGAEGMLGSLDVMKSPPDGYRVLFGGAGSMMIVTALRKTPPFDPYTQVPPIAGTVDFSFFLFVHPDLPANNLREFVDYAKANPNVLNYATGNNQGLLSFADLSKSQGLKMQHVAYKGEVQAISDLLPGRVQAIFATSAAVPQARDGKLRALVTTLPQRSPLLPNVPTMTESGFENLPFSPGGGWLAIFGPAGMEKTTVQRLNRAFVKALEDPEVQSKMAQAGLTYTPHTLPALDAFVKSQRDLYRAAIRDLGIPQVE